MTLLVSAVCVQGRPNDSRRERYGDEAMVVSLAASIAIFFSFFARQAEPKKRGRGKYAAEISLHQAEIGGRVLKYLGTYCRSPEAAAHGLEGLSFSRIHRQSRIRRLPALLLLDV